jgi:hypothetical protein
LLDGPNSGLPAEYLNSIVEWEDSVIDLLSRPSEHCQGSC